MGICASLGNKAKQPDKVVVSSEEYPSTPPSSRKTVKARLPIIPMKRENSYDSKDDRVTAKKKKWLNRQASKIQKKNDVLDWERVFENICTELNKDQLSPAEMDVLFRRLGTKVNRAMLQLIFSLFDADNSGTVDKTEFLVSITFLSEAQQANDLVDLAFFLFDTNRSGSVSKGEFSTMCYAMMNKAKFVLGAPFLRSAFRRHLELEHATENLDFYEAWEKVRKVTKPAKIASARMIDNALRRRSTLTPEIIQPEEAVIPLKDARKLYSEFICDAASSQVNLADANRKRVEQALKSAEDQPDTEMMDSQPFDFCIVELLNLMETDSMSRFKDKIRTDEEWLADQVWVSESIKSDAMNKSHFRKWAASNPGMFSFLEDLQVTLRKALYRQKITAAITIQRAYRARLRARLVHVVDEAVIKNKDGAT